MIASEIAARSLISGTYMAIIFRVRIRFIPILFKSCILIIIMTKIFITFLFTILFTINAYGQERPSETPDKPVCHMLGPSELEKKNNIKVNYRTYHEYLYSRRITRPSKTSIKEMLLSDSFSYPDISRWIKITKLMNKNNPIETGEIYLPPCQIFKTAVVTAAPPEVIPPQPEVVAAPAPVPIAAPIAAPVAVAAPMKKNIKPKYFSYSMGATIGSVNIKSNDELNSEFDLLFLKFIFSVNYQLKKNLFAYAGVGMNNYLSVRFSSDMGKDQSNEIHQYWDYFAGVRSKLNRHTLSIQYDNLNYLLNENQSNEYRLTPARVDRISIMDSYKLSQKLSLMGSIGYFHPAFSNASGFDFNLGPSLEVTEKLNLFFQYSLNELQKNEIQNNSQAFVLGTNYRF